MAEYSDSDALAAEIARLQAELSPYELASQMEQRPPMERKASEMDYIVSTQSYAESDDDYSADNMNLGSFMSKHRPTPTTQESGIMSYDEITVDTAELEAQGISVVASPPPQLEKNSAQSETDRLAAEIARMEAELAAANTVAARPNPPGPSGSQRRGKKKVLQRKVRKKSSLRSQSSLQSQPSIRSQSSMRSTGSAGEQPESPAMGKPLPFLAQLPQTVSSKETVVESVSDKAAPVASAATNSKPVATASLPFLSQIQQKKPDSEHAIENIGIGNNNAVPNKEKHQTADPLQSEIEKMQRELSAIDPKSHLKPAPHQEPVPPPRPAMGNMMLAGIAQAAQNREERVEKGELRKQDVEQLEAKPSNPMQLSTSMAEMISSRAAAREKRLADGGEKRMRKVEIKEKDEYKRDFTNIVSEAASMGRLTRLNEHVVEATAVEKTPEEEWRSNGLLAIQWRSNHMAVIHEAARMGNEVKLPEHIASNIEAEEQDWDPEKEAQRMSDRKKQLLELNTQVGEGQQKVEKLVFVRKEEQTQEHLLIKPMQAYNNLEDIHLPKEAPPKVDPRRNAQRLSKMKQEALRNGRPMTDISVMVAEKAWERRARLDRPFSLPKVKEGCDCDYCGTASPYQTFAYREIEKRRKNGEWIPHHSQPQETTSQEIQKSEPEEDEIERKRVERKRIREEKRKLKQALADAEAAINQAKADAQAKVAQPSEQFVAPNKVQPQSEPPPAPAQAGCRCVIM